jgi:hypothetical protein
MGVKWNDKQRQTDHSASFAGVGRPNAGEAELENRRTAEANDHQIVGGQFSCMGSESSCRVGSKEEFKISMIPPKYYSEWVQWLHQLKEPGQEDEKILSVLERGKLEWTPGVADKILNCTYDVIETKLRYTTKLFQQELDHACGQEAAIISAIINARKRFDLLFRLCRLAVFPDEVKDSLRNVVSKYVEDSQKALLESAKHDRTGQLSYIIRHNSLMPQQTAALEPIEQKQSDSAQHKPKRRVLF